MYKFDEIYNGILNEKIQYSKDGHVKKITDPQTGKIEKNVTINGTEYKYNSVYKTYNSIKGNELLHKNDMKDNKQYQ